MDILKLLSRGTKQARQSSATASPKPLPSGGAISNPQLFHDDLKGQKRKRPYEKIDESEIVSSSDDELNYFAPKKQKKRGANSKISGNVENVSQQTGGVEIKPVELLDEAECRQILRSHRLKVTILPFKSIRKAVPEKPNKSSKKKKQSDIPKITSGEEPKHVYPQPLQAFKDLRSTYGISKRLEENLVIQGYKIPTEVQLGSLPLLLRPDLALGASKGDQDTLKSDSIIDLLSVAPTGSGKTLAFLIPAVNSMIQRRRQSQDRENHCLEAIIVAPTKELASQIVNEGRKLALGTGIKVVGMQKRMRVVEIGDEPHHDLADESLSEDDDDDNDINDNPTLEITQPMTKADILVTTPLVLVHSLSSGPGGKQLLPTVRYLILDEADVLLDPLFREQTQGIWDACVNPDLQVTLWSATMGSNIESLASETIQARSKRLSLKKPTQLIRLIVGLKDSAVPNITHRLIYTATEPGKLLSLRQLLHPTSSDDAPPLRPPFLVFTQTIPRAQALHSELLYDIPPQAGGSARLAVLHSNLSSSARSAIMTRFRSGEIWILITTDILSRGVDFRGINGVVNYDIPTSSAAYIHRVGRTGRAGREGGVAVTFYTKEDIPYVKAVANVIAASEKAAGKPEGEGVGSVKKWLLDALPRVNNAERKRLKKRGVEARRPGYGDEKHGNGKEKAKAKKMQISTKSGWERKLENRKRGAIEGSKRRGHAENAREMADVSDGGGAAGDWNGFDE